MVLALNTVSGQIADVSPKTLLHPKFKDILVPVDAGKKPYNAVMYKPGTVEDKEEQRSKPFSFKKKEEVEQEAESNIDIEEEN
jgi:hypothetical protein